jgi:hypothetical protein
MRFPSYLCVFVCWINGKIYVKPDRGAVDLPCLLMEDHKDRILQVFFIMKLGNRLVVSLLGWGEAESAWCVGHCLAHCTI